MSEPERPERVESRVERTDAGWEVVADVDGARKTFGEPHPSEAEAEFYRTNMFAGSDRWTDAARAVPPDPQKYPGDGER